MCASTSGIQVLPPVRSCRGRSLRTGTPVLLQPTPVMGAMWQVWQVKSRGVPSR